MRNIIGNILLAGGSQFAAIVVTGITGSLVIGIAAMVVGLAYGISLIK